MKLFKISDQNSNEEAIQFALKCLHDGGVIMHATETCYGLAADVFSEVALKKLYALKEMSEDKPVSIMVRDLEEGRKYAEFNELAEKLVDRFWPGPLTLVLPRNKFLPEFFNRGCKTVGIRCPDSKVSQVLISGFGKPITTTSANISGMPEVYSVDDYLHQLEKRDLKPDVGLDSGILSKYAPSTVLEVTDDVRFLRRGDLSEQIKEMISE